MQTYLGAPYVQIRGINGEYFMVPKEHASKFNKRTALVDLAMTFPSNSQARADVVSKIIRVNRSIPKSVVAFPLADFNRLIERYGA